MMWVLVVSVFVLHYGVFLLTLYFSDSIEQKTRVPMYPMPTQSSHHPAPQLMHLLQLMNPCGHISFSSPQFG